MAYAYILPLTTTEIVNRKAWALIKYFAKMFPKAQMKIDVKYNSRNKYTVQHGSLIKESDDVTDSAY